MPTYVFTCIKCGKVQEVSASLEDQKKMLELFEESRPPKCCYECRFFESEWDEWRGNTYYFCNRNVFFPTKKQSCKKQSKKGK